MSPFPTLQRLATVHRLLAAGLIVAVAVTALLVGRVLRDEPASSGGAVAMRDMTTAELGAFSRVAGHPIFWAGEQSGATLSAGRSAAGATVVQYDAPAGSTLDGVMVATYPMADAAANLRRQAERDPRYELTTITDARTLVLIDRENADHAYLAEPGSDQQVEVHSPAGDHALRLVTEGRIVACCGA